LTKDKNASRYASTVIKMRNFSTLLRKKMRGTRTIKTLIPDPGIS